MLFSFEESELSHGNCEEYKRRIVNPGNRALVESQRYHSANMNHNTSW